MSGCIISYGITIVVLIAIVIPAIFFTHKETKQTPFKCYYDQECIDDTNLCGDETKMCYTTIDNKICDEGLSCMTSNKECASPFGCYPECPPVGACICPKSNTFTIQPKIDPNLYIGYTDDKPVNCPAGVSVLNPSDITDLKKDWKFIPVINTDSGQLFSNIQLKEDGVDDDKRRCIYHNDGGKNVGLDYCSNLKNNIYAQWLPLSAYSMSLIMNNAGSDDIRWLTPQPDDGKCNLHFSDNEHDGVNNWNIKPVI